MAGTAGVPRHRNISSLRAIADDAARHSPTCVEPLSMRGFADVGSHTRVPNAGFCVDASSSTGLRDVRREFLPLRTSRDMQGKSARPPPARSPLANPRSRRLGAQMDSTSSDGSRWSRSPASLETTSARCMRAASTTEASITSEVRDRPHRVPAASAVSSLRQWNATE